MHWFIEIIKNKQPLSKAEFETLPEDIKSEYVEYMSGTLNLPGSFIFDFMSFEQKRLTVKNFLQKKHVGIIDSWFDVLTDAEKKEYLESSIQNLLCLNEYKFGLLTLPQKIKYVNKYKNKYGLYGFKLDFWREIQKIKKTTKERDEKINQILKD